jgi:hypothetical protein
MMESRTRILRSLLAVGLLLEMTTACDGFPKTPTPTPAVDIPAKVVAARDAALAYLRDAYPGKAPPEGIDWTGRDTTPPNLIGVTSYEFTSMSWLMMVRAPVVFPGSIIYEVEVGNQDTGLRWTGKLSPDYALLESNLDVAVEVLVVREIVLSYIREHNPDEALGENLAWVGERTTPEGSVGHESCRFSADDWTMTVDYDLARPDQVLYRVELQSSTAGFEWRGQVNAEGTVQELQAAL